MHGRWAESRRSLPAIHRVRGYALLALGDADMCRAAFEASLRAARSRDAVFEIAMSLRALSVLARSESDPRADEMAGESQRLLRRLGVVAVAPVPREREILGLMAEGLSNAGICERLFISPKTLERHISSVFAKLELAPTGEENRRVVAVLRYLRGEDSPAATG